VDSRARLSAVGPYRALETREKKRLDEEYEIARRSAISRTPGKLGRKLDRNTRRPRVNSQRPKNIPAMRSPNPAG
jgi:hypothetical protein